VPIYAYAYVDAMGYMMGGEVGARDLGEASQEVRRRLGRRLAFVLWDRDLPDPRVTEWREKWLKMY